MTWLLAILVLSLLSCGGEWVDSDDSSTVTHCYTDERLPAGRSISRAAMAGDASSLYVLDNWSAIYRYTRDPVRTCGWELDGSWGSEGQLSLDGFVEDLDLAGGRLLWMDGAALGSTVEMSCIAERGPFAVAPGGAGIAVGTSGGVRTWTLSGSTCALAALSFGSFPVLGLAQDGDGFYTVEGVSTPQNLVVYSRSGTELWREPLSATEGNEKYFCGVDRLRVGSSGIFLLDKKCGRLGIFNSDGVWRKTLDLDSLGVRAPLDVLPAEQGMLYILVENQRELTVRLSSLLL
jgi:hypothetical protein